MEEHFSQRQPQRVIRSASQLPSDDLAFLLATFSSARALNPKLFNALTGIPASNEFSRTQFATPGKFIASALSVFECDDINALKEQIVFVSDMTSFFTLPRFVEVVNGAPDSMRQAVLRWGMEVQLEEDGFKPLALLQQFSEYHPEIIAFIAEEPIALRQSCMRFDDLLDLLKRIRPELRDALVEGMLAAPEYFHHVIQWNYELNQLGHLISDRVKTLVANVIQQTPKLKERFLEWGMDSIKLLETYPGLKEAMRDYLIQFSTFNRGVFSTEVSSAKYYFNQILETFPAHSEDLKAAMLARAPILQKRYKRADITAMFFKLYPERDKSQDSFEHLKTRAHIRKYLGNAHGDEVFIALSGMPEQLVAQCLDYINKNSGCANRFLGNLNYLENAAKCLPKQHHQLVLACVFKYEQVVRNTFLSFEKRARAAFPHCKEYIDQQLAKLPIAWAQKESTHRAESSRASSRNSFYFDGLRQQRVAAAAGRYSDEEDDYEPQSAAAAAAAGAYR